MKKFLIYLSAFALSATALSSCSDDDDPVVPGSSLEEKTYAGTENLILSINGMKVTGKSAKFTPTNDGNAKLTLTGQPLDLSSIIAGMTKADDAPQVPALTVPTAGVLPGSPSVEIPLTLSGDGSDCTFEGNGQTQFCSYSYSGSVNGDSLVFNLSDVELLNKQLVGSWTLPDLLSDPDDPYSANTYNIAHVVWDVPQEYQIELFPGTGYRLPMNSLIGLALGMTQIPYGDGTKSPLELLQLVLQEVTFGADGSVSAKYLDTKTQEVIESDPTLAQYAIDSANSLRLFLNPEAIIATTVANASSTRAIDLTTLVESIMTQLLPMVSGGIPIHFDNGFTLDIDQNRIPFDNGTKAFYLDTATLLPLLKAVSPLFADESFVDMIVATAANDPSMGELAGMLKPMLLGLPAAINATTKVEIGINLTPENAN